MANITTKPASWANDSLKHACFWGARTRAAIRRHAKRISARAERRAAQNSIAEHFPVRPDAEPKPINRMAGVMVFFVPKPPLSARRPR